MTYSINQKECTNCPLCGFPIDWIVCFAEEKVYYACCPCCHHEFFAHEFQGFLVTDSES